MYIENPKSHYSSGAHEMTPMGRGVDITGFLREKPVITISSFGAADIHIQGLRQEILPKSLPDAVGIDAIIEMDNGVPTWKMRIPERTLTIDVDTLHQDNPEILDRFFSLLDWPQGHVPDQLEKILPLLHTLQIHDDGEILKIFKKYVDNKVYEESAFRELLNLSRAIVIQDATPDKTRDVILFGVDGVYTDDRLIQGAQGYLQFPLLGDFLLLSRSESHLRRQIARFEVVHQIDPRTGRKTTSLWLAQGVERGSFQVIGKGGHTVYQYGSLLDKNEMIEGSVDSDDYYQNVYAQMSASYSLLYPRSSIAAGIAAINNYEEEANYGQFSLQR